MSEEEKQEREIVRLMGGKQVQVDFKNGDSGEVFVKELPVRKMGDFLAAVDNEVELIKMTICNVDDEWVDNLTNDSFEALVEVSLDVNFPTCERWMGRRERLMKKVEPKLERFLAFAKYAPQSLQGAGTRSGE